MASFIEFHENITPDDFPSGGNPQFLDVKFQKFVHADNFPLEEIQEANKVVATDRLLNKLYCKKLIFLHDRHLYTDSKEKKLKQLEIMEIINEDPEIPFQLTENTLKKDLSALSLSRNRLNITPAKLQEAAIKRTATKQMCAHPERKRLLNNNIETFHHDANNAEGTKIIIPKAPEDPLVFGSSRADSEDLPLGWDLTLLYSEVFGPDALFPIAEESRTSSSTTSPDYPTLSDTSELDIIFEENETRGDGVLIGEETGKKLDGVFGNNIDLSYTGGVYLDHSFQTA